MVRLRIDETVKRGIPFKTETLHHAADIKQYLVGNAKDILKDPNSLREPIRSKIEGKVPKRTKRIHFWS